ncbi:precorrin-6Y C5,15-methyltransferase (decarboxylating) subunit CbiT [Vulcanisaeta sp. JCM 14467]|uniref:precorrin-6Y C5,15-methyltransferase (decarboxylating) subunit CbiT n=1 Tax=Vulcanisaeta sp. JCM 14467 TaxID=1295370 RepID=UPI0006CF940A
MRWDYSVPGIPDEYFERGEGIPMTKEEVRALALSKLRVRRGDRVLDIGCGTGSVTVEAAILVGSEGVVYGVDRDERAIELTRRNAERFGVLGNVVLIRGEAPEVLLGINERFDRVFVGGGSERIEDIIRVLWGMLNGGGRVVVDAILVETVVRAVRAMEEVGFRDVEVTEVIIAKGLRTRVGTAMISRNPVFVISGEKP